MSLISLARSPLWLRCSPVRETPVPCNVWRRYGATPSIVASAKRSSSRGGGKPQNKANQRKPREVIDYESDGDDADDDDPILDDENALEALFLQLEKDWEDEKAGKKVDVEAPTEGDLVAFMKELSGGGKPKKKSLKKKQDQTAQAEQPEDMKEVSNSGEKLRKKALKERPELEDSEEEDGEQVLEAFMEELSGNDGKRKKKKATEGKQESDQDSDQAGIDSDDDEEEDEDEDTRSGLARFIEAAERLESERVVKKIVKLERWQLRKLKAALDVDKKDLKVKALAGDTGLDRRDVLTFLREPPPQLIELIDSISDEEENEEQEKTSTPTEEELKAAQAQKKPEKARETLATDEDIHGEGPKAWYGRKRIPREYLDTFEKVYRKHKRPTGALIQNIVELTHVPKKRVLDWFEARRQEDAIRRDERKLQSIRSKRQ